MTAFRIAALCAFVGLACSAAVNPTTAAPATNSATCTWDQCDVACGGGNRVCQRSDGKTWNIDCHVQDCTPVDACGDADIVFVIDSSASIGEKNWWKTKQFIIDVSKGLNIGPQNSRVAVVTYSNDAYIMWTLEEFNAMPELEENVWGVDYIAGNTNTYKGLLYADQVIDTTARADMKHIVIVITDGKANNQASLLIPQAEAMHQKGIEIFCVGISSDVDTDEVNAIASEPKDVHAHYVTDYSALITITNVIISDTCEAAGRVECDAWSTWSDCLLLDQTKDCGPGLSSRWRQCRFFLYDGADPEVRIHTEHRPCDDACVSCARCSYDVHGIGYVQHDNCHKFIQCEYVKGGFIEHEKNCGALFWRQSILGCDRKHDEGYICTDGPIDDEVEATTPAFVCDKDAHPSNSALYVWHLATHDVVMPCPPGTIFNAPFCQCVRGSGNDATCNSDTLLHFPFNTNTDDICNRAAGTALGNVTLTDGAAYFDGSSRVEVGFLNNWFAENPTTAMTVTLWFRYTGQDDDYRGIFSNGDCVDDASLLVALGSGVAQGQVLADQKALFDAGAATWSIVKDEWVFAALVYTGWDVKYYINGVQMNSINSITGPIKNTQCDTNIGFSGVNNLEHYFEGYIDDVRVYTKTLWDFGIDELYQNGRQ